MRIVPQTARQLCHEGPALFLRGLWAQAQRSGTDHTGPDQHRQGQQFSSGQKQPGQPAPAGRHAFHKQHGLPIELQKQQENAQHEQGGKNLQNTNKGRHDHSSLKNSAMGARRRMTVPPSYRTPAAKEKGEAPGRSRFQKKRHHFSRKNVLPAPSPAGQKNSIV